MVVFVATYFSMANNAVFHVHATFQRVFQWPITQFIHVHAMFPRIFQWQITQYFHVLLNEIFMLKLRENIKGTSAVVVVLGSMHLTVCKMHGGLRV